ncbi:hypothetical protein Fmac_000387 [Flemingia macrophylla]|uniref:Alpha/beta hydrolase fold-3 domain-containing protein n=1 Tax=Flemingia macrophylla TaxID=520843 RepID=A0ABD1NE46_9FABA
MDGRRNPEISVEVPPYLRVHKDGTVERLAGTHVVPAGLDSDANVVSKDILLIPETGLTARLYRPNSSPHNHNAKLPLLFYFHGGAFCISSAADPLYHNSLNKLVAEANVVALSVNYRLAPEHPLPTAYHDSWAAIQWAAAHHEELGVDVDFDSVFLAGDSAGANIGHWMALKMKNVNGLGLKGVVMVNPYFWGKEAIGVEVSDHERRKMVDKWWGFVCPSDKGNDDPLINPFVEEAPSIEGVACSRVLVTVAENDILRERGNLYHKKLANSGWKGTAEFYETLGEDHVFHIFDPDCDKAKTLVKRIAHFINQR